MAKYTIRDIARMAGVSRSTVSLVLNDSPHVGAKTRERVLEVIKEAGYRPSAQARGLVSSRAATIALIVPESDVVFRDFYLAGTINGVLSALTPRQYKLVIEPATRSFVESRGYDTLFQERRVDGALVAGARVDEGFVLQMRDADYPIALVNCDIEGVDRVLADNVEGARMVARHLASLGHTDIGYIRAPDHHAPGRDRHAGFVAGLAEQGLEYRPERVAYGDVSEYRGYEAMGKLLRQAPVPPTAVFAASDMMAIGAIQRLNEADMSVPDDVAVVGADDILLASYSSPALTTIRQPLSEIGRLAADLLVGRIEGKPGDAERILTSASLVIRDSCGAQTRPT